MSDYTIEGKSYEFLKKQYEQQLIELKEKEEQIKILQQEIRNYQRKKIEDANTIQLLEYRNTKLAEFYKKVKQENADIKGDIIEYKDKLSLCSAQAEAEIKKLRRQVEYFEEDLEHDKILKEEREYNEHLKEVISQQEKELDDYRNKCYESGLFEIEHLKNIIVDLEEEIQTLSKQKMAAGRNERGAGRKSLDIIFLPKLEECWKSGMRDKDIIENVIFTDKDGGIHTIKKATYYRLKKKYYKNPKPS